MKQLYVVSYGDPGLMCKMHQDCNEGEYCVARTVIEIFGSGHCQLAAEQGFHCSLLEGQLSEYFGWKFIQHGPCKDGLVCAPMHIPPGNTDRGLWHASLKCQMPNGGGGWAMPNGGGWEMPSMPGMK